MDPNRRSGRFVVRPNEEVRARTAGYETGDPRPPVSWPGTRVHDQVSRTARLPGRPGRAWRAGCSRDGRNTAAPPEPLREWRNGRGNRAAHRRDPRHHALVWHTPAWIPTRLR